MGQTARLMRKNAAVHPVFQSMPPGHTHFHDEILSFQVLPTKATSCRHTVLAPLKSRSWYTSTWHLPGFLILKDEILSFMLVIGVSPLAAKPSAAPP
jgi:hypothetical protein